MSPIKVILIIFYIIFTIFYSKIVISEPFVVLQYRGDIKTVNEQSDNLFMQDNNYKAKHTVQKNETLSDIILKYYGTKSFNKSMLTLAIVYFNKHAFVRSNPNFLYSGKKINLPSVNEIKNLIIKKKNNIDNNKKSQPEISSQIYFFGGWYVYNNFINFLISFLFLSIVSQTSVALTGEEITNQVDNWLLKKGVKGKSLFAKNAIYKDCKNDLKISRVFEGYKTVRVNCPDKNILNVAIRVKLQDQVIDIKNKKKLIKKSNKQPKKTSKIKVKKTFKLIKLNKNLEKKSVIKLEDLDLIISNKLTQKSFFNNKNELIGRKLKHNLKMGQLLHPRYLYEKFEIESGDFLSITSSIGNASVTVSGEAQNSGNLGDLISVKNLRSGKIVKGYIKKNKIIKVFR